MDDMLLSQIFSCTSKEFENNFGEASNATGKHNRDDKGCRNLTPMRRAERALASPSVASIVPLMRHETVA